MFIAPKPSARRDVDPDVLIETTRASRMEHPDDDPRAFEAAADLALKDAEPHGYPLVRFTGVTEFIQHSGIGDVIEYRYLWSFTAHKAL